MTYMFDEIPETTPESLPSSKNEKLVGDLEVDSCKTWPIMHSFLQ